MAHPRSTAAFTRKELLVVLTVLLVLGLFLIPGFQAASQKSKRITCICHLKQIGLAYRIWANDNGGQNPASAPLTNGGWRELLSNANAGTYAWTNYATMSNELGQSPLTLICPADERKPVNSFSNLANINCSYFVGVSAKDTYPQSILGGDRNLGPGTTPDPDYGYSPTNGNGNDVTITGPVCWSLKMHSRGNPAGAGNIIFGDGSSQQVTSGSLNRNWLTNAFTAKPALDNATNSPGMRLIFP
jgi:type II secretory pathway pseudopilin PulG